MNSPAGSAYHRLAPSVLALALSGFVAVATGDTTDAPITTGDFGWQLTQARVLSHGVTTRVPVGTLTEDYLVEAVATATTDGTPVPQGRFEISVSAFQPARDMPGQKAGVWYVRANWAVMDEQASEEEQAARHSPSIVRGSLSAELPFNPANTAGTMDAAVRLPMSPDGGRWSRGDGTFTGSQVFEGEIQIRAQLLPDVLPTEEAQP
ncbi:MAG: hypothetical protein MUC77_18660 [Chromatiaceae bacterium]|jgi:hypothetical protein|nr:hypothetical protein [Chromatiaceae bacterium]